MYIFSLIGAWLIWHILYRFRAVGRANLPRRGGYVLFSNHISATDPVYILTSRFWGRRMLVFAKEELFHKNVLLTWYLKYMGGIPVSRGKGDSAVIMRAVEKVRSGRSLLVFPEGTRSRTGELQRLKSGAFLVAGAAGVPLVPCRILYQGGRPRLFGRVVVAFGRPLSCEELGLAGYEGEMPPAGVIRAVKARCAAELESLLEQNRALVE